MTKLILKIIAAITAILILGCGGGGGGVSGSVTLTGRMIWLPSGLAPTPAVSLTSSSGTMLSNVTDGSFVLTAPIGATSIQATYVPPTGLPLVFTYRFSAVTANTDLGDLYLGPAKVTATGRVRAADTGSPLAGAKVFFAGQQGVTASDGTFSLSDVAWDPASSTNFFGISGRVTATSYLPATFGAIATGGGFAFDDILMVPVSSDTPPDVPGNIFGSVSPSGDASGTVVLLLQGGTPVRQFTVGADRRYYFWVIPGTYTISAVKGGLAATGSVTISATSEAFRRDLTLQ